GVDDSDGVLAALDGMTAAVQENIKDERVLVRRLGRLRDGRARGATWQDLLTRETRPGALGLATQILRRLTGAAGRFRRALAAGLRAEGATIPAIATLFGVSHQRVSALLRRRDRHPPV
ncbi:MAG: hypothetical protein QOI99_24, partial [Actinomycetota bacterium]|nr:hypothetical protein [Actinomycetota bacterium]